MKRSICPANMVVGVIELDPYIRRKRGLYNNDTISLKPQYVMVLL